MDCIPTTNPVVYDHSLNDSSTASRLRNAEPLVLVAVEAKLDVLGFIGVEVEVLVFKSVAARGDFAMLIALDVHVQRPSHLISQMRSDEHPNDALGFLEEQKSSPSHDQREMAARLPS